MLLKLRVPAAWVAFYIQFFRTLCRANSMLSKRFQCDSPAQVAGMENLRDRVVLEETELTHARRMSQAHERRRSNDQAHDRRRSSHQAHGRRKSNHQAHDRHRSHYRTLMGGILPAKRDTCSHRKPNFTREDLERRREMYKLEQVEIGDVLLNRGGALSDHPELRQLSGLRIFGDTLATYSRDKEAEQMRETKS